MKTFLFIIHCIISFCIAISLGNVLLLVNSFGNEDIPLYPLIFTELFIISIFIFQSLGLYIFHKKFQSAILLTFFVGIGYLLYLLLSKVYYFLFNLNF